ncbi:DUF3185 family protein [bacterium]|nr:DUF3185 family protein [bacterium]
MTMFRILGVAALVVGVVLLVFAFNASNAPVDQLANSLTGRYTDHTMWYLLGGIAAAVTGGALVMSGK